MNIILVDKNLDTGEIDIFHDSQGPLHFMESVLSEEAVHAVIMNIVDERMGEFLMTDDCILHREFNEQGLSNSMRISLIEYLEN